MATRLNTTRYMELLAVHQPRNLLVFMAVPRSFGGDPRDH